jgi:hypothetical protein
MNIGDPSTLAELSYYWSDGANNSNNNNCNNKTVIIKMKIITKSYKFNENKNPPSEDI